MRRSILVLLLLGCQRQPNCAVAGGVLATFPERDYVCEQNAEPPCELTVPASSDDARTVSMCPDLDGVTLTYVIDVIAVPGALNPLSIGFDFDGMNSGEGSGARDATCEEANDDFVSPDGRIGIDNAMRGLVSRFEGGFDPADCPDENTAGCLDARLLEDIRAGALLLVLELTGVDSFDNDPSVGATMYSVRTEDGAALRIAGADGRAVADQRFVVLEARSESVDGSILDGRLRVMWPSLTLPQSGLGYPDEYTRVELRADVRESGLENGEIGGLVDAIDFANATAERDESLTEDQIRIVFQFIADVTPTAADPRTCEHISAAYAFEGVPGILLR